MNTMIIRKENSFSHFILLVTIKEVKIMEKYEPLKTYPYSSHNGDKDQFLESRLRADFSLLC